MAVIETWYNQDLQQPVKVRYLDGSMFSHNGNGNRIGVRVYNDGEPVTLTGTVSGYVITSDGSTVPCVGARSGNEATITIPPAAYQPGNAFITIFLTDGSTVTTLCAAQTTVLQARTGSQVSPGSVVQDWTQTINAAMQDVQTAADNLGGIVATQYASLTYPVPLGKYTYYNGNLYRCISAIAASEEFTAAHWTQVRLGDDVTDLKSAIERIEGSVYRPQPVNIVNTNGRYWNIEAGVGGTAVNDDANSSLYKASDPIPVTAGQIYRVSGCQSNTEKMRIWVAVDDDNIIIAMPESSSGTQLVTDTFVIPSGATKLLLCAWNTNIYPQSAFQLIPIGDAVSNLEETVETMEDTVEEILYKKLQGKTIAIIGDSISTKGRANNAYEITIMQEDVGYTLSAYLTYYDVYSSQLSLGGHTFTASEIGTEVTFVPTQEDVGKKIGMASNYNPASLKVWWEYLAEKFGCNIIPVSWSGSSICSHRSDNVQFYTAHAWHPAQIRKCGTRVPGTMIRTAPDIVIIARGGNDFHHTPYARITDEYFDNPTWTYPATDEIGEGNYGLLEGYAKTIQALRTAYPNAQIIICTCPIIRPNDIDSEQFVVNNGINSLQQINKATREAADFFGCNVINFDKDGITFENAYSGGFVTDDATNPVHPGTLGHKVMGNRAIVDIMGQYNELN